MSFSPDTKIAITGGAGYIGSFTVQYLQKMGFNNLVILENFSAGHKETAFARTIEVDLLNKDKVQQIFNEEKFDAVIHFAAILVVPESMSDPFKYFHHNVNTSLNLLEAMKQSDTKNIVFSSTCAVYGTPEKLPISELESKKPENVYGETKLMIETIIQWYGKLFGINYALLRYFNACGAAADGSHGETHDPETHLIAAGCRNVINGKSIEIFGNDFDTPDRFGVRDYIHVDDLASAHHLALKYIMDNNKSDFFNLGTGQGKSTMEVTQAIIDVAKEHGIEGKYDIKSRRAGDPASLYADNSKAKQILGWNPTHTDIKEIVSEAFNWHMKQKS